MLTEPDMAAVCDFCGYPKLTGDEVLGHRGHQAYGELHYRLVHLSPSEEAVAGRYLSTLRALEQALADAAGNLNTAQAAVWSRNPQETVDRMSLQEDWRHRFCAFMGVPPGPALGGSAVVNT